MKILNLKQTFEFITDGGRSVLVEIKQDRACVRVRVADDWVTIFERTGYDSIKLFCLLQDIDIDNTLRSMKNGAVIQTMDASQE